MARVGDVLIRRATETFVGRRKELAVLLEAVEQDGPLVVHVHGIPGIGKSSLLEVCAERARERGATVVRLDCRAMEPTPRGLLHELATVVEGDGAHRKVARRLRRLGNRVVLGFDNYGFFRLMDTWLRGSSRPCSATPFVSCYCSGVSRRCRLRRQRQGGGAVFSLPLGPLEMRRRPRYSIIGVRGDEALRIKAASPAATRWR
jgi:hypothetical protein